MPTPARPWARRGTSRESAILTRRHLEAARVRWLTPGSPTKARVWLARPAGGPEVVVKDFRHLPGWLRWWGRLQVRREVRALGLLYGLPFVPRLVARLDPHAFAMTVVPGTPFDEAARLQPAEPALARLVAALALVHGRGIVHLDLRSRDNVRADASGAVFLVDWASALFLRPGSLGNRLLFASLAQIDRSAVVKWKAAVAPAGLSAEERAFARRWRTWRRLWPLNRKGPRRPSARRSPAREADQRT